MLDEAEGVVLVGAPDLVDVVVVFNVDVDVVVWLDGGWDRDEGAAKWEVGVLGAEGMLLAEGMLRGSGFGIGSCEAVFEEASPRVVVVTDERLAL